MTVRGFVRVLVVLVLSLTFGAGCNLLASDQDQALEKQKQKNEKLQKQIDKQKKEEAKLEKKEREEAKRKKKEVEEARQKELEQKVEDLQKKVDSQGEKNPQENASQPTESKQPDQVQPQQAEEQARSAAEAYYQAAAARNWGYTYEHLDSETQSAYTEQEWFAKNDYLADTGAVTYTIQSVVMDSSAPETFAYVSVVLTATDGSTNVRDTYFVYEYGSWLHRFSPEEYDLLASAPTGSTSASPSASASASGNPYGCPDASPIPATRAGDPGEGSLRCFATRAEANAYSQGN